MIKKYEFNYNYFDASCLIEVDHEIFTKEMALETLLFFTWDYDKENDPILEVLKKYASEILHIASSKQYNEVGVVSEFSNIEGYYSLDGKFGLKLLDVTYLDYFEIDLELEISE